MLYPRRFSSVARVLCACFLWIAAACSPDDAGSGDDAGGETGPATDVSGDTLQTGDMSEISDTSETPDTTPAFVVPASRAAAVCADYATARPEVACDVREGDACSGDLDCGVSSLCQRTFAVGNQSCECHEVACRSDDDCGAGTACLCATAEVAPTGTFENACGFYGTSVCASTCIDATCRSDADCGVDEVCTEVRDGCRRVVQVACWSPATSSCSPADTTSCTNGEECLPASGSRWACSADVSRICD